MTRKIPTASAVGIALPSLLAGALLGVFLRSRATEAAALPVPGPAPRAAAPAQAAPVRAGAPLLTPAPAPFNGSAPPAKPKNFHAAWAGMQEWFRGFDLKSRAGREKVPSKELQRRAAELQQALMNDPEGYLSALRSPENEDLTRFLLSLLCSVARMEGGLGLVPRAQIPKPILDAVPELLASGTATQKRAILELLERNHWMTPGLLLEPKELVDRCDALLRDPDSMVRVTAVQTLEQFAPKRADQRFEVLQELCRNGADSELRSAALGPLGTMEAPAAREFLLRTLTELAADAAWSKDAMLQGSSMGALQSRLGSLTPEEEEGYAAVCSSALRSVTEPQWVQRWMDLSLGLPLSRATTLMEQGQSSAPTPELQAAARRVLNQIQAGETRVERLRAALHGRN